ncbi:MAG: hypothetical protein V4563_14040 [Pseudomonadota bacterium]
MNIPLAKQWVAALRSGKYKQGKGKLRRGDEFCCLGVLCDLVAHDEWVGETFRQYAGTLPGSISEQVSVAHLRLATMNDFGKSFSEIADVIEAEIQKNL